jgi:hypothetical protein
MPITKTQIGRVLLSQHAALHHVVESTKPGQEPDGMLFRRTIPVSTTTELEPLLMKWNPGVDPQTIGDLIVAVCRWNQLKDPLAVSSRQQLLIPTSFAPGRGPEKRPGSPTDMVNRLPFGPPVGAPPRLAPSANLAEQRLRAAPTQRPPVQTPVARSTAGKGLDGSAIAAQFSNTIWGRRG